MLFLQLLEFIVYIILFSFRKKIGNESSPSIAEIINRRRQKAITTIPAN
jgi:hypothetical protein